MIDTTESVTGWGDPALSFRSAQSKLEIADGALCFELVRPWPNRWWRFWQKALLGWRWVDLREASE